MEYSDIYVRKFPGNRCCLDTFVFKEFYTKFNYFSKCQKKLTINDKMYGTPSFIDANFWFNS